MISDQAANEIVLNNDKTKSKKELLQNLDVQDLYPGNDQSPKLRNGFKKLRPNELGNDLK